MACSSHCQASGSPSQSHEEYRTRAHEHGLKRSAYTNQLPAFELLSKIFVRPRGAMLFQVRSRGNWACHLGSEGWCAPGTSNGFEKASQLPTKRIASDLSHQESVQRCCCAVQSEQKPIARVHDLGPARNTVTLEQPSLGTQAATSRRAAGISEAKAICRRAAGSSATSVHCRSEQVQSTWKDFLFGRRQVTSSGIDRCKRIVNGRAMNGSV